MKRSFARWFVALTITALVFGQGTWVLAGTTGVLAGTVIEGTANQPVSGAKVTVTSPSQSATTHTDGTGHYVFLNLAPDTYTVAVDSSGYEPFSQSGVTIVSDQTRQISFTLSKSLSTIATVKTRSASSLIKPGTTADVYSVSASQQAKVAVAGGGGNLNTAWSALATVPGVAVTPAQAGYIGAGPTLSIRGGDYDQIGYQIDGIPVNRAFDNYPSGPASSLGQQELQVYTGGGPASTTSEGISGYINQVIRTGTSPGYVAAELGVGGSPYYHKASIEIGGATDDHRFSYYAGFGGYNQGYKYVDQFQGAGVSQTQGYTYGVPCDSSLSPSLVPSCYTNGALNNGFVLGGFQLFLQSQIVDRDNVVNLHYYIPHKDGTRDDFQAMYMVNYINTSVFGDTNDQGGANYLNTIGVGTPTYTDGYNLNLKTGGFLPSNYQSLTSQYYFPNVPSHGFGAPIVPTEEDGFLNDQAIVKLQYTKSLGSNAIARVYGYTYYSDWLNTGPNCNYVPGNCGIPGDYELNSHTRGLSFQLSDQLNAQNLAQFGFDYTTSTTLRDNNTQYVNGDYGPNSINARTAIGVLVDSSNPGNGICYTSAGVPAPCYKSASGLNNTAGGPQFATIGQAYSGTIAMPTAGTICGGGPCQYLVTDNGQYATYNTVKPTFYGASLTDEFRPNSKLTLNAGLRLDIYQYQGSNTSTVAKNFWYAAYDREMCLNTSTSAIMSKTLQLGLPSDSSACPTGYIAAPFTNPAGNITQSYQVWQPRIGATYAVAPTTVIRASYGRYAEPPNSAYEQYDALQSNTPALLYGTYGFQQYGFYTPEHPIPPAAANSYDLSVEQQFPDQIALKVTPFYRTTQNQIQNFYLNRATSFVSGLNVGNQTARGVELEVDKGDFAQQGLTGKLSFAYTNSYIKYNVLSNGSTVLTPVVQAIQTYNSYTKKGGGSPCYTTSGTADPTCAAGDIANPYYNAPEQDPNKFANSNNYLPYDTIPAGIAVSSTQIGYPYVASLVLNERIKNFSIAPIVQYFAGQRYGSPLQTNGIDPATCSGTLAGSTAGDPRYQYGAAGGSPYDASTCGTLLGGIPNPNTGTYDGLGAFVNPSQLLLNFQATYEVNKNFSIVANLANVVNTCFGGSNVPWKVSGACSYGLTYTGIAGAIGNTYNPGYPLQPAGTYTYGPAWIQQPFAIYVNANFKL